MEHATGPRMPASKKKILVVGATGGVGRFVSDEAARVRVPMDVFPLDSLVEATDCDEVTLHWLK